MTLRHGQAAMAMLLAFTLLLGVPGDARAVVGEPVAVSTQEPSLQVTGSGWGHGVGMSQYGAQAQALAGWGVNRILRYWYRGVKINRTSESRKRIVVGMSSTVKRPRVELTEGVGQWLVCAPACTRMKSAAGQPVTQRPGSGTWKVVSSASGELSLRRGGLVLWRGRASKLRLRLSTNDRQRDVARVLGTRHRWGALEFGSSDRGDCVAPTLCVTARLPSIERYLRGLAEMPSSWAGAALGAQATVGRTFALRMRAGGLRASCRCHVLATPAHQVYAALDKEEGVAGERWVARVDRSVGKVVRYKGALAGTFYSSSHGGRSERIADSYAYSAPQAAYPYLRSVADPWSGKPAARNPYTRWTQRLDNTTFARYVDGSLERVTRVRIASRTRGGTPIELKVTGHDRSGAIRTVRFSGAVGKPVGDRRVWIVGAELKTRFSLRSQQISRIGLAPFADDDGDVHEYAVATLAASGVVTGCAVDRFCPDVAVTRAQSAALLARAFQLSSSGQDLFDDVGERHARDITAVAAAGVTDGCAARRFCPDRRLTRGQMASLLARALDLPATGHDAFDDDDATTHEDSVDRLAAAGITVGADDGRFRPQAAVTRAQMASFVLRALQWTSRPRR
ncbi:hypothetical protein BH23ACT10_BH23ACT10_29770 [soil metagenome]